MAIQHSGPEWSKFSKEERELVNDCMDKVRHDIEKLMRIRHPDLMKERRFSSQKEEEEAMEEFARCYSHYLGSVVVNVLHEVLPCRMFLRSVGAFQVKYDEFTTIVHNRHHIGDKKHGE